MTFHRSISIAIEYTVIVFVELYAMTNARKWWRDNVAGHVRTITPADYFFWRTLCISFFRLIAFAYA